MKTINQIKRTSDALKQMYKREVKKSGYRENMGDKYMNKFNIFTGDIYSYSYLDRLAINKINDDLFEVVSPI